MRKLILGGALCAALFITAAQAEIIKINPGPGGYSFHYQSWEIPGAFEGASMQGQTVSADLMFSSDEVMVAGRMTVGVILYEDTGISPAPTERSRVTVYLLNGKREPILGPFDMVTVAAGPGVVYPGGYYLPDGTEYRPAHTGYAVNLNGCPYNYNLDGSRNLDWLVFAGIRLEVELPSKPGVAVLGARPSLGNYGDPNPDDIRTWLNPIYISPRNPPEFYSPPPEEWGIWNLIGLVNESCLPNKHSLLTSLDSASRSASRGDTGAVARHLEIFQRKAWVQVSKYDIDFAAALVNVTDLIELGPLSPE